MAYKPPKQSIIDNDLKGVPSNEAVFEYVVPKPVVDGTSGQLLARGATANATSWVNPFSLPAGALEHQVLVYDGAAATWAYAGLGDGGLGTGNVALGRSKPTNITGANNILVGNTTGNSLTSGYANVVIGSEISGFATGSGSNLTTGYFNTLVGVGTGSALSTAVESSYVGMFAGYFTSGSHNSFFGYQSGFNVTTGTHNTFIGRNSGYNVTTGSGNTIIGSDVYGSGALTNTVIIGAGLTERMRIDSSGKVGFGTTSPNAPLSVTGEWVSGYGVFNVNTPSSPGFGLSGLCFSVDTNYKTVFYSTGTDTYLGSTGALRFATSGNGDINTNIRLLITANGDVGIGTTTPTEKLEVNGNIKGGTISFNADANRQATITNLGFLTATKTHDFGSIAHGNEETTTITVTGAAVGDAVFVGAPSAIETHLNWCAYVSAADTVTLRLQNIQSSGNIDPASATWRVTVLKS